VGDTAFVSVTLSPKEANTNRDLVSLVKSIVQVRHERRNNGLITFTTNYCNNGYLWSKVSTDKELIDIMKNLTARECIHIRKHNLRHTYFRIFADEGNLQGRHAIIELSLSWEIVNTDVDVIRLIKAICYLGYKPNILYNCEL
jgi:hypothetical protein